MKKVMFVLAMLSLGTLCWAGSAREDATERLDNATSVMHEIMGMPDKGIPEEVLEHAKCVAVIPHMVKGGFIFGAKEGKGVATCRTADGWSAPAFITISGGSWGLQIGVEAVDVVMIIQNDKGMQRLLESNFQIGGDASAAAGPVGRHAEAGTDWKMDTEILTYSRAKGAFAGLTLEGASLRQDNDSRHAIYGRTSPLEPYCWAKCQFRPQPSSLLRKFAGQKLRPEATRSRASALHLYGCLSAADASCVFGREQGV